MKTCVSSALSLLLKVTESHGYLMPNGPILEWLATHSSGRTDFAKISHDANNAVHAKRLPKFSKTSTTLSDESSWLEDF